MKFFFCLNILCFSSIYGTNDSLLKRYSNPAPLYKYYIYTEALHVISNAVVANLEINTRHRGFSADYLRLIAGVQKSDYLSSYYPELPGKYNFVAGMMYVLTKNRKQVNYELVFGAIGGYGDPTARFNLFTRLIGYKLNASLLLAAGLRYVFPKKVPIQLRFWIGPNYDLLNKKNYFIPGISLGYGFKKIKQ